MPDPSAKPLVKHFKDDKNDMINAIKSETLAGW